MDLLRILAGVPGYAALLLAALAATAGPAGAQTARPLFETIDFPGAASTTAFGIDDGGGVVGLYHDQSGKTHGFARRGGMFTSIDFPGAEFTMAKGIGPGRFHGFARQGARYATIDVPDATATRAMGVNRDGAIVGTFVDRAGATHGFVRSPAAQ